MVASSDLAVEQISDALQGRRLDVIVSGSIGAVESVRFLRSLRRLGAEVQPWLTKGGALFTTDTALSWAAANPCRTQFEGTASHIALGDACIIAPASSSIIARIAAGQTDTPTSALIASYLGQKKPVYLVPNMHDSLHDSPFVQENLQKISPYVTILGARREEDKQKFPEPAILADHVAHKLNQRPANILITLGTTRGYIDDVRYISNYSSGALGSRIAEELYRQGFQTTVVHGPSPIAPRTFTSLQDVETNAQMEEAVRTAEKSGIKGAIFAASVLDFIPKDKVSGKIRSHEELKVEFQATPKIIGAIQGNLGFKVGFKLETGELAESLARDYLTRYKLSHLVMNNLQKVSAKAHEADVWRADGSALKHVAGKETIARLLAAEAKKILG